MLREFLKELSGERVEGELIKTIFYSLLTSFIFLGVLYFLFFRGIEGFMSKHGIHLFFSALGYALIVPSIRQIRAYKELPCMSGMMVGMTTGMIASFLTGFYLASTNAECAGQVDEVRHNTRSLGIQTIDISRLEDLQRAYRTAKSS